MNVVPCMRTRPSYFVINRKDVGFLAGAAVALVVATIVVSPKHPMWYDETFSWTLITDPSFRHMLYSLRQAAESPPGLYHVLARMWLAITGQSVLALRLFSTVANIVALVVIWATLRRAFSFHATALGVLTVFCTSAMMLVHSAEARYYPLFVACVALVIAAFARAVEAEKLNWRLAAALFFSNLALVLVHIYGVAYSAALLLALVLSDLSVRRFRPLFYATIVPAWLALIPILPVLHRVNEATKPRHWIEPPTLPGVVEFYRLYSLEMPLILFAVALLCFVARLLYTGQSGSRSARIASALLLLSLIAGALLMRTYPTMLDIALLAALIPLAAFGLRQQPCARDHLRRALLLAAAVLLAAPPAAGIFSLVVKPVFVPKYVLPSMLGMVILLTWIAESGSRFPLAGRRAAMIGAAWTGLLAAMLLMPPLSAIRESADQPPTYGLSRTDVEALIPQGMPVAVESYFEFLPLRLNTTRAGAPYHYVGDADAAWSPAADRSALLHYRGMQLWKTLGYLSPTEAPEWRDFVAQYGRFAVIHSPGHLWFEWRIKSNPDYSWRSLGKLGPHEVFLVERNQQNATPDRMLRSTLLAPAATDHSTVSIR